MNIPSLSPRFAAIRYDRASFETHSTKPGQKISELKALFEQEKRLIDTLGQQGIHFVIRASNRNDKELQYHASVENSAFEPIMPELRATDKAMTFSELTNKVFGPQVWFVGALNQLLAGKTSRTTELETQLADAKSQIGILTENLRQAKPRRS